MKNAMRLTFVALAAIPVTLLVGGSTTPRSTSKTDPLPDRGEYLVRLGGCTDCHTPKKVTERGVEDDMSRFLAGHDDRVKLPPPPSLPAGPWSAVTAGLTAWSGPWGVSYAANLTPDVNTGLGIWTEEMFFKAMRMGKHYGAGRDILPPMPWQNLSRLTDDDLRAIFAYLRSIPPVRNRVPDPVPPGGHPGYE
jgi:mono/diheme cytochrome c family protein